MNRIRNHSKELIVLTILLAVAVSVVNASVFVYYPIDITANWVQPKVYFAEGSNAGGDDLRGQKITVNLGDDGASVSITVHPCRRQTTYYENVTIIVNDDTQAYNVWIRVKTPFGNNVTSAQLIIEETNQALDLKGNNEIGPITLNKDKLLSLSLKFEISRSDEASAGTAVLDLIYSPTSKTPP